MNLKSQNFYTNSFTLIELLVVISIIGLLGSIVLASLGGAKEQADLAKAKEFSHTTRVILGADLVGEWRFDDESDPTRDSSGYDNDGDLINGPQWADDGVFGKALEFDGSTAYIDLAGSVILDLEHSTISFWMKRDHHNYETIFSRTQNGGSAFIEIDRSNNKFFLEPDGNNDYSAHLDTKIDTSDGRWHHYVIIWTRAPNTFNKLDLYTDGDFASSYTGTGVHPNEWCQYFTINFMAHQNSQGPWIYGEFFEGAIDEVQVYNKALSIAEVQHLYAQGAAEHDIVSK